MTVLRGGWGVLLPRRQQGLSKMMAYSICLHVFLFLFIVLNRAFFSSRTTSFQGFQVNLVAPGGGVGFSSGGSAKARASKRTASKKSPKKGVKASAPAAKKTSPKKAAPKAAQAKTGEKAALPQLQSRAKPIPSVTRAPRRSVNAPPPEKEDPERLQEWWKKQKKALKTPSATPGIKPKMGISERTRTAKIDIQKRPDVSIPLVSPSKAVPKTIPQVAETPSKKQIPPETESSRKQAASSASEEQLSEGVVSDEGTVEEQGEASQGDDNTGSMQAAIGPGITGVGPSGSGGSGSGGGGGGGGGGGVSFLFPSYLQKVDQKIRWHWAPPPVTSSGDRLVIRFVIQKNGRINKSSVEIEESSGNLFFDAAAIRAIPESLPPLPKAYGEDVLIVFMNFVVREDS